MSWFLLCCQPWGIQSSMNCIVGHSLLIPPLSGALNLPRRSRGFPYYVPYRFLLCFSSYLLMLSKSEVFHLQLPYFQTLSNPHRCALFSNYSPPRPQRANQSLVISSVMVPIIVSPSYHLKSLRADVSVLVETHVTGQNVDGS